MALLLEGILDWGNMKRHMLNLMIVYSLLIVACGSVSALNLDFNNDAAGTCPIDGWTPVEGVCIANSTVCNSGYSQYYLQDTGFVVDGNAFVTCNHAWCQPEIVSDTFYMPEDAGYLQAEFYGCYGFGSLQCYLQLEYANGTYINKFGRFSTGSQYYENTWEKNNITVPTAARGKLVRLRINDDAIFAETGIFAVDNITILDTNITPINMSNNTDEYPSSGFSGYVNELDGETPVSGAYIEFCRVSGATNFCPTCSDVNITRCLSLDYDYTDSSGFYNKTLVNGIYEIRVEKAEYGRLYAEETILAGQSINYSLPNYTLNYTMISGYDGEPLEDFYINCIDDGEPSNYDETQTDADGLGYVVMPLIPDEMTCSFSKSGFTTGDLSVDYSYTCSELLDSDVMTCEWLMIAAQASNMSITHSTLNVIVRDIDTGLLLEDATVILYQSDADATKTGLILDTLTTGANGTVSFYEPANTYYYLTVLKGGYEPFTTGSAAVGRFPAAGHTNVETIYLTNMTMEYSSLLVNFQREDSAYAGVFNISCTHEYYDSFAGSYQANGSGQVNISGLIPTGSECIIQSFYDGVDVASCADYGGVCAFTLADDLTVNVSIPYMVKLKVYVLDSGDSPLFGEGANIRFYNCTNDTYESCSYYATKIDSSVSERPYVSFANGTYVKVRGRLAGYNEDNSTIQVTTSSRNVNVNLLRNESQCVGNLILYSDVILDNYPYDITFTLTFSKYVNGSYTPDLTTQLTCDPLELTKNTNDCIKENIPMDCDTDYKLVVDSSEYDREEANHMYVSSGSGEVLMTVQMHTTDQWLNMSSGGSNTVEGEMQEMETYFVGNFLWIIFQLALIVMVLFLLTTMAKMISGGGG